MTLRVPLHARQRRPAPPDHRPRRPAACCAPSSGKVFDFDQTPQALQSLAKGGIRGKAVITVTGLTRLQLTHLTTTQKEEHIMSNTDTSNEPVITSYAKAPARTITAGGVTYAYRELGPKGGIPVVFFVHLAATLDNWDPRIIDPIAQGPPRHHLRQPRRRRLHRPGSRQHRGDGRRRLHLHQGARVRQDRHLLLLPRRHDRPGPRGQAPRARPQARPHRHRAQRAARTSTRSPAPPTTTSCARP